MCLQLTLFTAGCPGQTEIKNLRSGQKPAAASWDLALHQQEVRLRNRGVNKILRNIFGHLFTTIGWSLDLLPVLDSQVDIFNKEKALVEYCKTFREMSLAAQPRTLAVPRS